MKNYWEDQTVTTSKRPQAAGDHPAEVFAREVGAKSVVLPSPPRHERSAFAQVDVKKIWELYGAKGIK